MNGAKRHVHFIGVGGIGMSGLAEILLDLGYTVSGSDLQASEITTRLEEMGLVFSEGHAPENLRNAGIVVMSAAVDESNAELQEARRRNLPILQRSDLLADLMRLKPNAIAVGGSHGKTTTTSMISAMLDHADIGATSIIGGILHRSGSNAHWGAGTYLVAEACEHMGSFLRLHPTISVVTNIDAEHLEYYGTLDNIKRAFTQFCNRVPFYGYAILCADDPNCRGIMSEVDSVRVTFGLDENASLRGVGARLEPPDPWRTLPEQLASLRTSVDVVSQDERLGQIGKLGTITVNALGDHNIRNALAACTVGLCLGMPFETIAKGLAWYNGVRRRLQVRGTCAGITVVEDYAHHPTEIAATISAARALKPSRLVCVFQPHLYSRAHYFHQQFAEALSQADRAIVTDIYPAREAPMPGVHAGLIVDAAASNPDSNVELMRDMHEVPAALAPQLCPGDLVLLLGAGTINRIADPFLAQLEALWKERARRAPSN